MTGYTLSMKKVGGLLLSAVISTLLIQVAYRFGEREFTTFGQILIMIYIGWEIWEYRPRELSIDPGCL